MNIGDYNWAEYVHRIIFSGITSGRRYCIGCAWVLLVWAYEKNPNLQPPHPDETIPFKQWCRLPSSTDNILTCPQLPVLESNPPTIPTPRKNPRQKETKIKALEKEVDDLKNLLKHESDKSSQLLANMTVLQEENIELKKKLSELLSEKKKEPNPPHSVTNVVEPSSLVKRIKKRTVSRFSEKNKEITTKAKRVSFKEEKKATYDIPTQHKNDAEKQTKVYQSKRAKRGEQSNKCTAIVLKETIAHLQPDVRNDSFLNMLEAGSHSDPEEYVSRFLSNKKFLSKFNYSINNFVCVYKDLYNLIKGKEIAGAIIDCYIEIIKAKYQMSGKKGVFFMDSIASQYIYGNIDDSEPTREKMLMRMDNLFKDVLVNIEECRKVLIPVNKNFHWHLLEIDFEKKSLYDYNSLLYKNDNELERWFGWWYSFTYWKKIDLDVASWELEVVENFPQQFEESVDCGIFMMKTMEDLALEVPITFSKDDIPAIRMNMAAELIRMSRRTDEKKIRRRIATCK